MEENSLQIFEFKTDKVTGAWRKSQLEAA